MLARYRIVRGKRDPSDPLPDGERIDTRKHTQHFLRPETASVEALIEAPTPENFRRFAREYQAALTQRMKTERRPFDELAARAKAGNVFLGCNCPTAWNPDVSRCHTTLALAFMQKHYPALRVRMP